MTGRAERIWAYFNGLIEEFVRVLDDPGFDPIREIYGAMGKSSCPVFTSKTTYVADVNRLWGELGYRCSLTLDNTEGLTDW
jgi:hypothetical protein